MRRPNEQPVQTDLPSIREAPQLRPRPRTKCRYFCHSSPPYVTYCPHRSPALSCKFLPECTPVQSEAQTKIHCTPHSDQIPPHALHESLFVPHMPCMEKHSRVWRLPPGSDPHPPPGCLTVQVLFSPPLPPYTKSSHSLQDVFLQFPSARESRRHSYPPDLPARHFLQFWPAHRSRFRIFFLSSFFSIIFVSKYFYFKIL